MNMNNLNQGFSVKCGKTTDSFDELKMLCEKEADKLLETIDFSSQSMTSVAFWTTDIPELICVGDFLKKKEIRFLTIWIFHKLLYSIYYI